MGGTSCGMAMLCDHDELVSLLILSCVSVCAREKTGPGAAGILILLRHACNDGFMLDGQCAERRPVQAN